MTSGLGRRPSRSTGPEIETAPSTAPVASRTGADSEATPGSRSATLCAQPRRRTSSSVRAVKLADGQQRRHLLGRGEGEQRVRGRAGGHGQPGADRHGVAQPAGALGGGDADPGGAVADVELGALAAGVAQGDQVPAGELGEVGRCRGRARRAPGPGAHAPAGVRRTSRWPSSATASRWAVARGRPVRSTSSARVAGSAATAREDGHRFVQDGDGVRLSHTAILSSHTVGWPVRCP